MFAFANTSSKITGEQRSRIDAPSSSCFSMEKAFMTYFEVDNIKKPHNFGEELAKPAAIAMVKTPGGADNAKKVESTTF